MMTHGESRPEVNVLALSQAETDSLLQQRLLARLATFSPDGSVHVVPMWFMRERQDILIPTSRFTRKIMHLGRRPEASVVVDQYGGGEAVRGVMIQGSASIIDGEEAGRINRSIHERYVEKHGLESGTLADYLKGDDATIRIAMKTVRTWKVTAEPKDLSPFRSFLPLDF
jgi:nitroimidazol reductase NimA-like FMN-containing flavoprotein (pyridoxamine 5'-phosphate oxidase superfamily)